MDQTSLELNENLQDVQKFWNNHPCGKHFIDLPFGSSNWFQAYRDFRYDKEHHLVDLIDWKSAKDKSVLEIGLGMGADGTRWAQHAASYTGLDLTPEAVQATSRHLEVLGLQGNVVQGNSEDMPFEEDSFDIVYSHGVLHHTEGTENAFREVRRVLKPGGQFICMLYTKDSFNYWFRIQGYMRARVLLAAAKRYLKADVGEPWSSHLANLDKMGMSYLGWEEFPHHCTDGPDCTIAKTYRVPEVRALLRRTGFELERSEKAHLPLGLKNKKIERELSQLLGFYQYFWAK